MDYHWLLSAAVSLRFVVMVLLVPTGTTRVLGASQLIGPPDPIVAVAGDDVILPCSLEPSIDAEFLTVEWSRPDLEPRYVHFYRDGRNVHGRKNPSYKYRTMLFEDELVRGNVSLKLFRVKLEDEGSYTCLVVKDRQVKKTVIQLSVVGSGDPQDRGVVLLAAVIFLLVSVFIFCRCPVRKTMSYFSGVCTRFQSHSSLCRPEPELDLESGLQAKTAISGAPG